MSDSIERRVFQVAADVFNLPLNQVTRETSPESVANWDSVQYLNFVLAIEQELGVQLDPEDIERMHTVGSVIDTVRRKGI